MSNDLIIGALLVVLGFGLGFVPPWLDRSRRLTTHWQALRAEILICVERVDNLLNDNIASPLYRLPMRAFDAALKALLAEGAKIKPDEIKILFECADLIGDVNRGLDACAELATTAPAGAQLVEYHNRNVVKADRLRAVILPSATRIVHEKLK